MEIRNEEKTRKSKYSQEVMADVIEDVRNGSSYYGAAKKHKISGGVAAVRSWCLKAGVKSNFKKGNQKKSLNINGKVD